MSYVFANKLLVNASICLKQYVSYNMYQCVVEQFMVEMLKQCIRVASPCSEEYLLFR